MTKPKLFNAVILLTSIIVLLFSCVFCMGNSVRVNAEENGAELPVTDETTDGTESDEEGLKTLVDGFLAQLKEKYGEDYETYYNAILSEWGSVEEYLLSLIDEETPDAVAHGWRAFVGWLGDYAPIWGSILAVTLIIIVLVFGKKAMRKVADWLTGAGGKFKTVFNSINKLYKSHLAQSRALIKLLGENEKFSAEREALKKSAEEIEKDDEV